MKIYEVYESSGQYEDRFDYRICAYISKEKAEQKQKELQDKEQKRLQLVNKCYNKCPLDYILQNSQIYDEFIRKIKEKCSEFIEEDENNKNIELVSCGYYACEFCY